jgi:hypothetical protein
MSLSLQDADSRRVSLSEQADAVARAREALRRDEQQLSFDRAELQRCMRDVAAQRAALQVDRLALLMMMVAGVGLGVSSSCRRRRHCRHRRHRDWAWQ